MVSLPTLRVIRTEVQISGLIVHLQEGKGVFNCILHPPHKAEQDQTLIVPNWILLHSRQLKGFPNQDWKPMRDGRAILQPIKLYALNAWVVWYMNYISIKSLKILKYNREVNLWKWEASESSSKKVEWQNAFQRNAWWVDFKMEK